MSNTIHKFFPSIKNRVNAKFAPVDSSDSRQVVEETINDLIKIQQLWNTIIYPLVGALPQQPLSVTDRTTQEINPVANGLDGTQFYVDRLTQENDFGGKLWNTNKDRPNTISEQVTSLYGFISEEVSRIGDNIMASGGIPESVQIKIGKNVWDNAVASDGTNKFPPEGESIDARSLNSKSDILQLASDLFAIETEQGEQFVDNDYIFTSTHPGVQTLPVSLRQRIIYLEEIHGNTAEENKIASHNEIIMYDPDITDIDPMPNLFFKLYSNVPAVDTLDIVGELAGRASTFKITQLGDSGDSAVDVITVKRDVNGDATLILKGNVIIEDGSGTSVQTTNMEVSDNIIILNNGESGSGISLIEAGIEIDRGVLDNAFLLYSETYGWTTKIGSTYDNILTESSDINTRVNNMTEFMRYSRVILGVAGDMVFETASATAEEFAKGSQQDIPSENVMSIMTDASRSYRLMIQYSDEFIVSDNMNVTIKITGADSSTHSETLPLANVNFANGDNTLFVSSLFSYNFEQDTTWEIYINGGDGVKLCDLMRVELFAYDVFQPIS